MTTPPFRDHIPAQQPIAKAPAASQARRRLQRVQAAASRRGCLRDPAAVIKDNNGGAFITGSTSSARTAHTNDAQLRSRTQLLSGIIMPIHCFAALIVAKEPAIDDKTQEWIKRVRCRIKLK